MNLIELTPISILLIDNDNFPPLHYHMWTQSLYPVEVSFSIYFLFILFYFVFWFVIHK